MPSGSVMKTYSFSECLAHPPDDFLTAHLSEVAQGCRSLWRITNAWETHAATLAGLLHDVGKANRWFQSRMYGVTATRSSRSDHAAPSAFIAWHVANHSTLAEEEAKLFRLAVFVAVLRHHGNLTEPWEDEISRWKQRLRENSTEARNLREQLGSVDLEGISSWLIDEVTAFQLPLTVPPLDVESIISSIRDARPLRLSRCFASLDRVTRFLGIFGGLLYNDKIHSATGAIERRRFDLPDHAASDFVQRLPQSGEPVGRIRREVASFLEHEVLKFADERFFTITAPTGSGKTLAVFNAALRLRRLLHQREGIVPAIIYCLPFTSVIEQNFDVCRQVLSEAGVDPHCGILLKHHHLSDPIYISPDESDPDDSDLFTESWRSEIVVTTFHQLLYAMFTGRNRNLKRFAALSNAIVIMDEVQAIRREYWEAVRRMFQAVGEAMNARFILMTATQPLLFTPGMSRELLPDHRRYFEALSRVRLVNRAEKVTELEWFFEVVVSEVEAAPHLSRMCVINRKGPMVFDRLFELFCDRLKDRPVFALSTRLTPKDRRHRIWEIRDALSAGVPCFILTTQLIEAGVDLSVDVVDRDLAPFDSVIQAAGRCNRHGGDRPGIVNLWELALEGKKLWRRVYDPFLIDATRRVFAGLETAEEKEFLGLGQCYFREVYECGDSSSIDALLCEGSFKKVEEEFKLIDDDGFRESFFIIRDDQDREVWERYQEVREIPDRLERKRAFVAIKGEFYERIVQVRSRRPSDNVICLEATPDVYDEALGFMEEPGSLIL